MSLTVFNPDGVEVLENSAVIVAPAVADLDKPTVAEYNAGTAIQCSIKAFGISTDVSYVSSQYLCDKVAKKRVGNREYNLEPLTIKIGDPQAETISAKFVEDSVVYLIHRPGLKHTTPAAASQKAQVIKARVAAVDLVPIGVEEGSVYELRVALAVEGRNSGLFVTIAS